MERKTTADGDENRIPKRRLAMYGADGTNHEARLGELTPRAEPGRNREEETAATQEKEQRHGRGGRRAGAGRKATGRLRKTIQITLPAEVLDTLREVRNKSLYIEELIRKDMMRTEEGYRGRAGRGPEEERRG